MNNNKILILTGPTASGKTSLSVALAKSMKFEIINCDAMQVYTDIPILTAQPTEAERENIPHHLYGYLSGDINSSVANWLTLAHHTVDNILYTERRVPMLVGGSGLYIKSFIEGMSKIPIIDSTIRDSARSLINQIGNKEFFNILSEKDPNAHRLNIGDTQRILRAYEVMEQTGQSIFEWHKKDEKPKYNTNDFLIINVTMDREELIKRIDDRFLIMVENGVIDEVDYVKNNYSDPNLTILKAHGLPEISKYLDKELSLNEAIEKAQINTRQYAKRQRTWIRHQLNDYKKIDYNPCSDNIHDLMLHLHEFLNEGSE
jgi:tRNA dimethylallyltransferase